MAQSVICPVCKEHIDKDTAIQVGRRYCCSEHADEYREKTAATASKAKESKDNGYKELIAVIVRLFHIVKPTGLMLRQLQSFHNSLNLTYDGMRATIIYCATWSTPPVEFDLDRGLAFVPYKYDEARRFYEEASAVQNDLASIPDVQEILDRERIVEINAEDLENSRRRLIKHMDIESMIEEGDMIE